MRGRYVLLRWTPTIGRLEAQARALAERLGEGWRAIVDWRGVLLLVRGDAPDVTELPHGRGAIVGDMYDAHGVNVAIDEDGARSLETFVRERWGSYVAIVIDRGRDLVRVLRSPNGAVPCFLASAGDVRIVFSEAIDFVAMAPETEPDLNFLAEFLAYPRVVLGGAGFKGVQEIAPGEAVVFSRDHHSLETLWSPRRRPEQEIVSFDEAAAALLRAGERTIQAIASLGKPILHRLSGGFDSSIVLGLLARHGQREAITCINEYWPEAPEGDEREVAAAVARQAGVRLVELAMDPREIAYDRLNAAPLSAKPTLAVLSFADRIAAQAYASVGAEVLTSGRGGDHVFHRSRTASIAADAVRDGASELKRIAVDTARLSRRSVWGVFSVMAREGALRCAPPAPARSNAATLMAPRSGAVEAHPWDLWLRRETPARAQRVRHVRDALSYHDRSATTGAMQPFPPLLAQPIIDTCLRIPPYVMTKGGFDRSLARAAFREFAPPLVLGRSLKGETTRYFATILAANRTWINDVLPTGELVQSGLIDAAKLRDLLGINWRQDGVLADGLYSLIAAEAWLQNLNRSKREAQAQCIMAA